MASLLTFEKSKSAKKQTQQNFKSKQKRKTSFLLLTLRRDFLLKDEKQVFCSTTERA